jgi:hypothetical protein
MTNKEAIKWLRSIKYCLDENGVAALDKALSALEQLPEPEVWRDAEWPRDASNPPLKARFRNFEIQEWHDGCYLFGQAYDGWIDSERSVWKFCQVRDE